MHILRIEDMRKAVRWTGCDPIPGYAQANLSKKLYLIEPATSLAYGSGESLTRYTEWDVQGRALIRDELNIVGRQAILQRPS